MALLYVLLPLLVQGALSQLFSVEPHAENVVKQGDSVLLECTAYSTLATCTWKVIDTDLGVDGFILDPIPENVDITARDPSSKTDCSIMLNNVDSRYDGTYICSPFTANGGQEDSRPAKVIVAQKPVSVEFSGDLAGRVELAASGDQPTAVTCEARDARPAAELAWYLGNTQLYDNIDVVELQEGADAGVLTTRSVLTRQFTKDENGAQLRCLAAHTGYDEQDLKEASVVVDVQYAPYRAKGNNVGTLYGFTEGQEGRIIINFTANPEPFMMVWKVGDDMNVPTGGQSADGRFTANTIEILDKEQDQYSMTLVVNPIRLEDQLTKFELELENQIGLSVLQFNLGTGPAPPPEGNRLAASAAANPNGLGMGALVGIIVAIALLVLIIVLVAFARSRGKWCFQAHPAEAGTEASDTESAHDEKADKTEKKPFKVSDLYSSLVTKKKKDADIEMAANKDETKELTKPDGVDGAADREKKEGEVVYAELMLNSDGVKTEVRPSAEKSEYAVIVGTKKEDEADAGGDDNE